MKSWKERFWEKVDMSGGEDDCWPWTGAKTREGYGRFCMTPTRVLLAHRVARGYFHPTPGKKVYQRCGNPACCNPAHLRLKKIVRRGQKGENSPSSHLTEEKVREMRELYAQGGVSFKELAERFGVCRSTIRSAVRRETWRHV
jgi:hypothetical protein